MSQHLDDVKKLIIEHQRRLQKLREQEARLGKSPSLEILIEIKDIEAQLGQLQAELKDVSSRSRSRHNTPQTLPEDQAGDELAGEQHGKYENVNITISDTQIQGEEVSIKGIEKTTTVSNVGEGAVVVTGDDNLLDVSQFESGTAGLASILAQWQIDMEAKIESAPKLLPEDKDDLIEIVGKIKDEAAKAEQANPGRLERLISSLAVMGPDIFEVAIATLANPLNGMGLVLKKINDKATIERKAQST